MLAFAVGSGIYLDVPIDWGEVATLLEQAHGTVLEQRLARVRQG